MTIRSRLTLTYVTLLVTCTGAVLAASWWVLSRHLARTLPAEYASAVSGQIAWQYLVALAGTALLALGIGYAAAGHALAPVRAIARTAARISDKRLDERVALDPAGPRDELHELAETFDAMLDRLGSTLEAQKRFVANASHELRTPLTVIRTGAEVALETGQDEREALRGAVEGAERAEALLDGLLLLAGASRGVRGDERVDLGAFAAPGMEVEASPTPVRGDPALLERLVGNLVENAVRHGEAPRRLTVRPEGGDAVLRVSSGGERLEPEAVARLAEPFERGARVRAAGSGLGLSIVRAVAEAHGGALTLSGRPYGGLVAEVRLPLTRT